MNLVWHTGRGEKLVSKFPSIETITALLKGLNKNGQIGRDKAVIELSKERVPPFSSSQMNAFKSIASW